MTVVSEYDNGKGQRTHAMTLIETYLANYDPEEETYSKGPMITIDAKRIIAFNAVAGEPEIVNVIMERSECTLFCRYSVMSEIMKKVNK